MPELGRFYEFRGKLVEAIRRDIVGPHEDFEIIGDAPITAYIAGILYPQSDSAVAPEQDIDVADDYDEVVLPDPPVAMANTRYPSSMGLTFAVDLAATTRVEVNVEAARYEEVGDNEGHEEGSEPVRSRARRAVASGWKRRPLETEPLEIQVSKPIADCRHEMADGLELFWRVRKSDEQGRVAVTVVLLNKLVVKQGLKDASAFFQPRITVSSHDSDTACFVDRPPVGIPSADEDLQSYALLYRHSHNFATGHGCSVQWNETSSTGGRTSKIWTDFVPDYALKLSDSNPEIDGEFLQFEFLIDKDRSQVLDGLEGLCRGYQEWIEERHREAEDLDVGFRSVADTHLAACLEALQRMRGGIEILRIDEQSWSAFRMANEAMLEQRARTDWIRAGKGEAGRGNRGDQKWRPFQLAFILLCLRGISDNRSPDRALADLLWFPTGGGKTEAYLGLIAFTLFLRRLKDPTASGVAILMRYTLRLLTIQQFERAAMLMCSCEMIRRSRSDLGTSSFSIGLWVGEGGTPNSIVKAGKSLDKLRQGFVLEEANPVQLHSCPWCGTPLDHHNYWITNAAPKQLRVSCRTSDCDFRDGLPVKVVDEDIYRDRPSLVISTVDKFASLPWNPDVASIFNLDADEPAPELIIQDELHLISGPLGTLTGLYETAVDYLCSTNGVRPKVIASTATIRRAGHQTVGLFDRELRQFPPSGLDARNSYFAVESPPEAKGTRLYLGLMTPGTSQTTLLVRTYAALLQFVADLEEEARVKDPYWTLVGYFNSLRVLGGARMQVQDDVADRMELLASASDTSKRSLEHRIELTSREPSGNIPDHLRRMAIEHPTEEALDVILATNMISVGMDIDRLGLMAVMGQPQSTSEYIQSTSRVGRKYPGLVAVLLNAARSRDRSHYESFVSFHSAIYRQVESTSVTPFSSRARDRGLHSVLIALCRLLLQGLRENKSAYDLGTFEKDVDSIKDVILHRVKHVAPDEYSAAEHQLSEILDQWKELIKERPGLVFQNFRHPDKALLVDAGRDVGEEGFETTRSLRDVDMASNLYLVKD